MRKYEVVCVFHPSTEVSKIDDIISKAEKKIKDGGGKIEKVDKIGVRPLNYSFKKFPKIREGYYAIIYFSGEGAVPGAVNAQLRLTEDIMRYSMILSKKEKAEEVEVELPGAEIEEKTAPAKI